MLKNKLNDTIKLINNIKKIKKKHINNNKNKQKVQNKLKISAYSKETLKKKKTL